jgi:hypothetical protein
MKYATRYGVIMPRLCDVISIPRARRGLALAICLSVLVAPKLAAQQWVLEAGPFKTAANVANHNKLGADILDIRKALANHDWTTALAIYAYGRNFPWQGGTHSFGRFADDYHGSFRAIFPMAEAHGHTLYKSNFMVSALFGTGRFAMAGETERRAAVEAGLLSLAIDWCRLEVFMAHRKATQATSNWSLENGAPKNWNEIFAFHWGPGGRGSVFEAIAAIKRGDLDDRLLKLLAEGQSKILARQWPAAEADAIKQLLDEMARTLFRETLSRASAANEGAFPAARGALAGAWLAAAETIGATNPKQARAIETAIAAMRRPEDLARLTQMLRELPAWN